jgi:hypothetical protein
VTIGILAILLLSGLTLLSYSFEDQAQYRWGATGIYGGQASASFQIEAGEIDLRPRVVGSSHFYVSFESLDGQAFNSILLFLPPNATMHLTAFPVKNENGSYDYSNPMRQAIWDLPTPPEKGATPWPWYLKAEGEYPWDSYSLVFIFGFNRTLDIASVTSGVWISPALSDQWRITQEFKPLGRSPIDALKTLGFRDQDVRTQLCYDCDSRKDLSEVLNKSMYKDFYEMRISFVRQFWDVLRGVLAFWVPAVFVLALLIIAFGRIGELKVETGVTLFVGVGLATLPLILGSLWLLPPRLSLVESLFYCEGLASIAFAGFVVARNTRSGLSAGASPQPVQAERP